MAADDDMLAGVLAHEIAHITEKHALSISGARRRAGRRPRHLGTPMTATSPTSILRCSKRSTSASRRSPKTLFTGFDPKTGNTPPTKRRDLATLAGLRARRPAAHARQDLQDKKPGDPKHLFSTHPPLPDRIQAPDRQNEPLARIFPSAADAATKVARVS